MQVRTSLLGGRMSKPIRRALPIYVACVLFLLYITKPESLESLQQKPSDVFRRVMSYQSAFGAQSDVTFPRKIWQTWKVAPLDFEPRDHDRARSWTSLNPGHRYEVLTDGNDLEYVETHFGPNGLNRPDIVYIYRSLTAMIVKADILRYLVMYIEGGVYADIDVEAVKPIDEFIPADFSQKDIDLVVSVEIDEPNFINHTILGPKSESFCQWTFMCKPRSPTMLRLIENVLEWVRSVAKKQNVPIAEIVLDFNEVITGTGPSAFTNAVMAEMKSQTYHNIPWEWFHNMTDARRIGNILVLPVKTFAAGQGHSNSGDHDAPEILVKHHYHASLWPSRHPRYSHPAYGMVEECNWDPECVQQWDEHTAAYDSLSPDEQARAIADKEVVDRERFDREEEEKRAHEQEDADRKAEELRDSCQAAGFTMMQGNTTESATSEATAAASETPAPRSEEQRNGSPMEFMGEQR